MKPIHLSWTRALLVTALAITSLAALAQEAAIRKNLGDRLPDFKQIDEVRKAEMPGLYEVRMGSTLFYTDAKGGYLLQGELIDVNNQRNLTEERVNKLTAVDFSSLPLKDAFTIVRGNGKRQLAVFEDPNCGYCKRFERDLQKLDNVTVHLFLYPILGNDSMDKSRNIWCAPDRAVAWEDWMVREKAPASAQCDVDAIKRNVEFGRKYRITGTPTLIFADGTRIPGAIPSEQVEQKLSAASR